MTWHLYVDKPKRLPTKAVDSWLASAPPWRAPQKPWKDRSDKVDRPPASEEEEGVLAGRARSFRLPPAVIASTPPVSSAELIKAALDRINAALHLRRPILISGDPGVGKSSLAWHLAWVLGLGPPLKWEIGSRTTLQDGLYHYDAIGHLQATRAATAGERVSIGPFVTLGPLGTALLPTERPRLLLIDELDKSGYDLPNDLLHVFEDGRFVLPELKREKEGADVYPHDARDQTDTVRVERGEVVRHHPPVVVITTNGERVFPEAFLRRCVVLEFGRPDNTRLAEIVDSWFGAGGPDASHAAAVAELLELPEMSRQATDVVLQALYLQVQAEAPRAVAVSAVKREKSG
ncbi:MAG: AAA family ATPase [Pseudomonadota bacterium]|nr:AAA family ATPase [Pseudomonadota bacterium]